MIMPEKKSHRKIYIIGAIAAAVMFGFSFAMVPLYNLICQVTGSNTTVANSMLITKAQSDQISQSTDLSRDIKVQFVATNHNGMPWDFYPRTKSVMVHPGQKQTVYFYAKNTTDKTMTVQAIPSMTPAEAMTHFHKIECFCFRQQTLKAGESKEMGLTFQIDNNIEKDTHVLTLSYTLFDATPKETRKG
jgi:cytochrome c oxidase assembly protein subunit 11